MSSFGGSSILGPAFTASDANHCTFAASGRGNGDGGNDGV